MSNATTTTHTAPLALRTGDFVHIGPSLDRYEIGSWIDIHGRRHAQLVDSRGRKSAMPSTALRGCAPDCRCRVYPCCGKPACWCDA